MCSRAAARPKWSSSATATKYRRWRSSILPIRYHRSPKMYWTAGPGPRLITGDHYTTGEAARKYGYVRQDRRRPHMKPYLLVSDFDQTLSFNDSGRLLSELLGISGFDERVAGLSRLNLVQEGAELAYLIRH